MVLALLEVDELVTDAFGDEYPPRMLLDNGFLVLQTPRVVSGTAQTDLARPWVSLTLKIESSTFSISPGLAVPAGRDRNSCSLRSLVSMRRSRCGMLFRA